MAKRPLPDADTLRKLLRYEPETGKLFWLPRTPDLFDCKPENAASICKAWNSKNAGKEAFVYVHPLGYPWGSIFGRALAAHRAIWCLVYGHWPEEIDHVNRQRADNRLSNLREVSHKENCRNFPLRRDSKWGRTGVSWIESCRKWQALITVDGKSIALGYHKSYKAACKARDRAERLHGFHENHGKAL